jgi:hypothetical protein
MGRCYEHFLVGFAVLVATLLIDVQAQADTTQQQGKARHSEVNDETHLPFSGHQNFRRIVRQTQL